MLVLRPCVRRTLPDPTRGDRCNDHQRWTAMASLLSPQHRPSPFYRTYFTCSPRLFVTDAPFTVASISSDKCRCTRPGHRPPRRLRPRLAVKYVVLVAAGDTSFRATPGPDLPSSPCSLELVSVATRRRCSLRSRPRGTSFALHGVLAATRRTWSAALARATSFALHGVLAAARCR